MNIRSDEMAIEQSVQNNKVRKKAALKSTHSLEYDVIANLVLQQYEKDEEIRFDLLWSISATERIPALALEYGNKRMYQLIATLLREFCISIPLPKTKKLNDTRINVCACDLMVSALEEELSIEDFILFFERVKKSKYGPIKKFLTHQLIKEKWETYLTDRSKAFADLSEKKHTELKAMGPAERTCNEPKQIGELIKQAAVIQMNKRMSG